MRCVCSSSIRTAPHCGPSSTCGRQAAAPAHCWPSIESTCSLPGASSALMALRTGCCCLTPAMPGPGALQRTVVYAWPPDTALSEPPDETPPHRATKMCLIGLKLNLFPLLPWLPGSSEISLNHSYVTLPHTHLDTSACSQIHCHK